MDAAPQADADDRRLSANSDPSSRAQFYCDTFTFSEPSKSWLFGSLYPKGQEGLAKAVGWWIEKGSFMNAVCLTIGSMPGLPQELSRNDVALPDQLDPEALRPKRAMYLQRVNAHIAWPLRSWPTSQVHIRNSPSRAICRLPSDLVCTTECWQRGK